MNATVPQAINATAEGSGIGTNAIASSPVHRGADIRHRAASLIEI
jgi:hypothetical protein